MYQVPRHRSRKLGQGTDIWGTTNSVLQDSYILLDKLLKQRERTIANLTRAAESLNNSASSKISHC